MPLWVVEGDVLFAFALWSVRWKDDQRRSNRCFLKPQKKTDVQNLYYCRAFVSRNLEWKFCLGISVFRKSEFVENDTNDCYMLCYEIYFICTF